jgi:iron complex outermembrane receptor protein
MLSAGVRYEHTQYDYDNRLSTGSSCEQGIENAGLLALQTK